MEYLLTDNVLTFKVDMNLYNEAVLYKCFYWYSRDFNVTIDLTDVHFYNITIHPKKENDKCDWDKITEKIPQDLIDFKLRDIVNSETKNIRELIVAKAFVYYDVERLPLKNITDPVGFDPQNI